MIPTRTPFFLPWLYPGLTWRMDHKEPDLYLTFDDGPVSGPTEFVLDTLAKYSCKATFFCIGDNVRKFPNVLQRIVDDGHAIGNHTYNHMNGWKTPLEKYIENVALCDSLLPATAQGDQTKKLFRPPYGRITGKQVKALRDYNIVMWDVLTHDYNHNISPENCLVSSMYAARAGSIIVFHDSHKAERNMTFALPRFIEHFLGKGYHFKSLPS